MALMNKLKDRVMDVMEITPEQYYSEELRPLLKKALSVIKYDDVFLKTVELALNKADSQSVNLDYDSLKETFSPISYILNNSKSQYMKEKRYLAATEEEKAVVNDISDKISQMFIILKCTPKPEKETGGMPEKQRLRYDETRKENV